MFPFFFLIVGLKWEYFFYKIKIKSPNQRSLHVVLFFKKITNQFSKIGIIFYLYFYAVCVDLKNSTPNYEAKKVSEPNFQFIGIGLFKYKRQFFLSSVSSLTAAL